MGAGGSKKKKEEDDMSLVKRAERRFESYGYPVMDTGSTDVVQTADKYDFLLVFRDPEDAGPKEKGAGSGGGGAEEGDEEGGLEAIFSPLLSAITPTSLGVFSDETLNDEEQVSCKRARTIWKLSTPGPDTSKAAAEEYFNKAWKAKFHKPWETVSGAAMDRESVPFFAVRTLFREMICDTLSSEFGLQLKLSRAQGKDPGLIMCRVRAPMVVLEQEADRLGYPLQFRDEVDPGPAFWYQGGPPYHEILEEARDLSREKAEQTLLKLYEMQKISANDMGIFDNEPREKAALWSRRVHTLERIADMVCSEGPGETQGGGSKLTLHQAAYAPFATDPKRRHLFRQYRNVRGKTLLQSKDRLRITASIVSNALNIEVLKKQGLVVDLLALHDANLGEVLSNEVLTKRWVFLWKESRRKVGAPTVSSSAMHEKNSVNFLFYPFSQPLNDIRAYFGEKVAFFYAWLGYVTLALLLPAVVGLALQVYLFVEGFTWCSTSIDWFQTSVAAFVILWTTSYSESWKGEQAIVSTKWGVDMAENAGRGGNVARPAFTAQKVGDHGSDEWYVCGFRNPFGDMEGLWYEIVEALGYKLDNVTEDYRRNPISNRSEPYYPAWLRSFWIGVSFFLIFLCVCAVAAEVEALMVLEHYLTASDTSGGSKTWGVYVTSILVAVLIPFIQSLFARLAVLLTDNENHFGQSAYDSHLAFKVFLLNTANYFGALLYICFVKQHTYGCANDCCMDDASIQFIAILVVTVALRLAGPFSAYFKLEARFRRLGIFISRLFFKCILCTANCMAYGFSAGRGSLGYLPQDYFDAPPEDPTSPTSSNFKSTAQPWEQEYDREPYPGNFKDMSEAINLFSLVVCFVSVFPAAPIFLIAMNLLHIRMSAYDMMAVSRRPVPETSSGMGLWCQLTDCVAIFCALINSGIIVFTCNYFSQHTDKERFLLWLSACATFVVCRKFLQWAIPAEPFGLADLRKRHRFLRLKHIFGFIEDDDDGDSDDFDALRVRGVVDLEAMDLSKMVGSGASAATHGSGMGGKAAASGDAGGKAKGIGGVSDANALVEQIRSYQVQLRRVNNKLEEQKRALQDAMQHEIMNNKTGIGETLNGLPLGCLSITLERIEGFMPDPLPFAGNIQIVISLRSNDPLERSAPGPPPGMSKRGRPTRVKGDIEFEELFTLAPVKSHKADIFFDIMDSSTDPKRRGTAFLSLAKLKDQMSHHKAIYISQRDPDNPTRFNPSDAKLKVKVQFKYSKIKPIKDSMASLTKEQATIEKAITMARLGNQRSDVA